MFTRSFILYITLVLIHTSIQAQENQWAFYKGDSIQAGVPVYGSKRVTSISNRPGQKIFSTSWTDNFGNLWLFGGQGTDKNGASDISNELWKFDPAVNSWTWISGDNIVKAKGVYGIKGAPSTSNVPGARYSSMGWTDRSGNLWLFGGLGVDATGNVGNLNDLWKYNISTNQWTLINGNNTINQTGNYGFKGIPNTLNRPGSRYGSTTWTDAAGNFWLFGGDGFATSSKGNLNDMWTYDVDVNNWTWMSGDTAVNQSSIYGIKGIASSINKPGARNRANGYKDKEGNLYLSAGIFDGPYLSFIYNDLWKFELSSKTWTWTSGDSLFNQPGSSFLTAAWSDTSGIFWNFGGSLNHFIKYDPFIDSVRLLKGIFSSITLPSYGIQGVADTNNYPPSRFGAATWVDSTNNLWLYGGSGSKNDLWKYNIQNNTWTWTKGDNQLTTGVGIYGTPGVFNNANKPGPRSGSVSWKDNLGNLWLFGGSALTYYDELWTFKVTTGEWAYIRGGTDINEIYGTKGLSSPTNKPGARYRSSGWSDANGNLWLFGGSRLLFDGVSPFFNELWKFNTNTKEWTWMSGNNIGNQPGIYGTKGLPALTNVPGAREDALSMKDGTGKFWLFGGSGYGSNISGGLLNDIWVYDPVMNTWTWMQGDKIINQKGVYGTKGVSDIANKPGARKSAVGWYDSAGNLWIFGGTGFDKNGNNGVLNDLWKFNIVSNSWTWMSGDNTINSYGIYGIRNAANSINKPGNRMTAVSWIDSTDKFYLSGGEGFTRSGYGKLNDLWSYDPLTSIWTWLKGDSTSNNAGKFGPPTSSLDSNIPGARGRAVSWTDDEYHFWLFGGDGYDQSNIPGFLSDLWKFKPSYNLLPIVSINSPANSSSFPAYSPISLFATAADPDGRIAKVEFYNGSVKFYEDSIPPYGLTSNEAEPGNYLLTAMAYDNKGFGKVSDQVRVTVTGCTSIGNLTGEGYTNISGTHVADMTSHPSYPNSPSITADLNIFEYSNVGENYGGRLSGYICAPFTGNYTFYIAGDDQAGLFLSTDDNPANKVLIAYNVTPVGFRAWTATPTQKSPPIKLLKGVRYYIETQHKQSTGNNHLSVRWVLPNGVIEAPIPGTRLSPFGAILSSGSSRNTFKEEMKLATNDFISLEAMVQPNPSRGGFTLKLNGKSNEVLSLIVTDIAGRVVEIKKQIQPNSTLQLGNSLAPGVYFLQVTQGSQRRMLKLIRE